jgi:hypothetical protein
MSAGANADRDEAGHPGEEVSLVSIALVIPPVVI